MTNLIIIAAIGEDNTIAIEGEGIPWDYPKDMEHYKKTVSNEHLLMGRKTFESIRKPLDKKSIILTKNKEYTTEYNNTCIVHSKEQALDKINSINEYFYIIGGESIYRLFLENSDKLIISEIPESYETKKSSKLRKFPKIDPNKWNIEGTIEFEKFIVKTYSK